MSEFIDYGDYDFRRIRNSNFVDKSGLLKILNRNRTNSPHTTTRPSSRTRKKGLSRT